MKDLKTPHMNTMSDCTNNLTKQGYTENFQVISDRLKALSDGTLYIVSDVVISNFYRFEGQSDPSDNSIIYTIETPDEKKGMLIDAYGSQADAALSDFIRQVEEFQKKIK